MLDKIKKLKTLTVFNNLLSDKAVNSFIKAVEEKSTEEYSRFVYYIYNEGGNFSEYLLKIAIHDENIFLKLNRERKMTPVCISYSILRELKILRETGNIKSSEMKEYLEFSELSDYDTEDIDFVTEYMNTIKTR